MSRLARDGTAKPVSRDQILRHERGQRNIHFFCSTDHVQDWQPYPVDPYSRYICVTIHISNKTKTRDTMSLNYSSVRNIGSGVVWVSSREIYLPWVSNGTYLPGTQLAVMVYLVEIELNWTALLGVGSDGCRLSCTRRFLSYFALLITLCVCVFFPFILDIKFVGRTSRGHTGGRSHRMFHPPSFCGACLYFSRDKDSAIPFPRRPRSQILCTNDFNRFPPVGHFLLLFFSFYVRKIPFAGVELTSQRVRGLRGTSELPGRPALVTEIHK